jgi:hypothetical protein
VSGWDDRCDGKLRVRTSVSKHRSGTVLCPSEVEHMVQVDNVSVCDLEVRFTSTPEDAMLQYPGCRDWCEQFGLEGSSSRHGKRSESRLQRLSVADLRGASELRRELSIKSTAQYVDADGTPAGPVEPSTRALLRLTLRRGT